MVRERSPGLFPGFRDVAEILIISDMISMGKGLRKLLRKSGYREGRKASALPLNSSPPLKIAQNEKCSL